MTVETMQLAECRFVEPGDGEVIRIFDEEFMVKLVGDDTSNVYAIICGTVAPGGGPPLHSHPTNETFYVLAGEIEFTQRTAEGVTTFRGGPGAIAHAPAGVPHRFENVSSGRSAMLTIVAPEMIAFLKELAASFPPGAAPDMECMLDIHARYQIETYHGGEGSRSEPVTEGATSARARSLAWQYQHANDELIEVLERCSDVHWRAVCGDTGWSVGVQADHLATNTPVIAQLIRDAADGRPHLPTPKETLDEINARHARESADVTKGEVLPLLRDSAASAAELYRRLTDEQLDLPAFAVTAGAPSVAEFIERLAIGEIERHGVEIRRAIGG
jgi:quercetin dioxygenase-like cupin family protein